MKLRASFAALIRPFLAIACVAAVGCSDPVVPSGGSETKEEGSPAPSGLPGCPEGMVAVPGGTYPVGDPDPPAEAWYRLKASRVKLPSFCIDQYEYPGRAGELPRAGITWHEADALCRAGSKRLCSEHEWVAACRGPEGRLHSYGDSFEAGRCQTDGPGSKVEPIGSRPDCKSPLGVHDLNGSLSEWVADPWDRKPLPPLETGEVAAPDSSPRVLRGGTMWFAIYGQDCRSRHSHNSRLGHLDDGFRCCGDL